MSQWAKGQSLYSQWSSTWVGAVGVAVPYYLPD